jgi:hypothetical protein
MRNLGLDTCVIPFIVGPVELRDPQVILIFDDGFRTGPTHGCAFQDEFPRMLYLSLQRELVIIDDRIGESLQLAEVHRPVCFLKHLNSVKLLFNADSWAFKGRLNRSLHV